jgi:hypothetical protein
VPGRRPPQDLCGALAWRGLPWGTTEGKRLRKKVSGQTKPEVRDKLKEVHSDLEAGVLTSHGYTMEKAVADWLADGLPGRSAKTVEVNRDTLRPLLAVIGTIPLAELTVKDVRTALSKMAATHATRTIQKAHNCQTRAPSARLRDRILSAETSRHSWIRHRAGGAALGLAASRPYVIGMRGVCRHMVTATQAGCQRRLNQPTPTPASRRAGRWASVSGRLALALLPGRRFCAV